MWQAGLISPLQRGGLRFREINLFEVMEWKGGDWSPGWDSRDRNYIVLSPSLDDGENNTAKTSHWGPMAYVWSTVWST